MTIKCENLYKIAFLKACLAYGVHNGQTGWGFFLFFLFLLFTSSCWKKFGVDSPSGANLVNLTLGFFFTSVI